MQDFTLTTYKKLLYELLTNGYSFQTLQDFVQQPEDKIVILRHDVDRFPINALTMAETEADLGIKATYYFRTIERTFKPSIIKKVAEYGHEIGYHYENLGACRGDYKKAIIDFGKNLKKFRKIFPVKTICMHGNAFRRWDNRSLWDTYNYKDYGIICEPYLDLDFNKILYLTDTGQKWNGRKYSIRDKINMANLSDKYNFESTKDILSALDANLLPKKILINIHPERWQNNIFLWSCFFLEQFVKRNIKILVLKKIK